jgi:hypothetical protein
LILPGERLIDTRGSGLQIKYNSNLNIIIIFLLEELPHFKKGYFTATKEVFTAKMQ